jgi:hypothetical protein
MLAQGHREGVMSIVSRIVAGLLLTLSLAAHAGTVLSTYTPLGGNQWSVAFSVTNTGEPAPVSEFTVYFAEGLFANLAVTGSPGTWDSIVIQPDPAIPADGFFDALALDQADALDDGESQSGFSMTFDFLGTGMPREPCRSTSSTRTSPSSPAAGRSLRMSTAEPRFPNLPPGDWLALRWPACRG